MAKSKRLSKKKSPSRLEWNEAQVALLGTASDQTVAKHLGVTVNAIARQRYRRGIPAFGASQQESQTKWGKRQLAKLGKVPDSAIAEAMGINITTVANKRRSLGIEAFGHSNQKRALSDAAIKLLGSLPDTQVAKMLGTHRRFVMLKRRELGILNYTKSRNEADWVSPPGRCMNKRQQMLT